ncbi:MAG: hydrogenase expression/formation protein HypE, partial [Sulfurimicrobium sp.]|nr:hydrogenase expression/formation protein HypE [Sulfurimicrobium sp.]
MTKIRRRFISSLDLQHGRVDMTHGSGGRAMAQLVEELFVAAFDNEFLRPLNDQACFTPPPGRLVMATDSHVVT